MKLPLALKNNYIYMYMVILKDLFFFSKSERKIEKKRIAFYGQFVSAGDIVFDVGANMGNRVKVFLQLGTKVVAIEPQRICCNFLKLKFGNKINIVNKGAGENENKKPFYIANASVLSSFSEEFIETTQKSGRFKNFNWNKPKFVDVTTLDIIIREHGIPQFIKIDVEGYELEVLKGLSYPINYISFEYFVPEAIGKTINCIKQIGAEYQFNFSIGESMEFTLNKWLSMEEILKYVNSKEFEKTNFGDIYARKLNLG